MIKKSVLLTALAIAGFAVTSLAQTVPNYVPTNGLVGWWPFNGNATDESINTNDGTVNGATLTADRFGNANSAYSFNGTSNYILINNTLLSGSYQSYSISYWFKKSNGTNIGTQAAINDRISTTSGYKYYSNFNIYFPGYPAQNCMASQNSSTVSCVIATSNNMSNGAWNNVIISFDASINAAKIYYNGNLEGTTNFTSNSWPLTNNPTFFGASPFATGDEQWLNGQLDDIGIWNRALTQQEITTLYNGNLCFQTITVTDTLLINTNITGFNPVTYQNTIKIWPNPTNDHITIDNGNLANLTGHQIKISNALGQQVFQSAITQQQFYVNMSTWGGNGIYFVNLINAQGVTIETRKIVLQ